MTRPLTILGYPSDTPREKRVTLTPQTAQALHALGARIVLEKQAGLAAGFPDEAYGDSVDFQSIDTHTLSNADLIFTLSPLPKATLKHLKPNTIVMGLLSPYQHQELLDVYNQHHLTTFPLELLPRTSRAQSMDVLSSQASVAGYQAAVQAALLSPRFFPMMTTAAGTLPPAKVFVIGAGVAGLSAIATAKRLGAHVTAYDIRPEAREQIESLGATMLETAVEATAEGGYARALQAEEQALQAEALQAALAKSDVVITTAAVPGRKAPIIVTETMLQAMQPGSLLVDLAAEQGGNCALTEPNQTHTHQGVTVTGPTAITSEVAHDASAMLARNFAAFATLLIEDKHIHVDWEDDLVAQTTLTHAGSIRHSQFLKEDS